MHIYFSTQTKRDRPLSGRMNIYSSLRGMAPLLAMDLRVTGSSTYINNCCMGIYIYVLSMDNTDGIHQYYHGLSASQVSSMAGRTGACLLLSAGCWWVWEAGRGKQGAGSGERGWAYTRYKHPPINTP